MASLRMNQFYKTKTCPWFYKGRCERGDACRFAHSDTEKRKLPDLSKTSLCTILVKYGVCNKENCRFAHNIDELRATNDMYKTSLCFMFMKSRCEAGDQCRHAHGAQELRVIPSSRINLENEDHNLLTTDIISQSLSKNNSSHESFILEKQMNRKLSMESWLNQKKIQSVSSSEYSSSLHSSPPLSSFFESTQDVQPNNPYIETNEDSSNNTLRFNACNPWLFQNDYVEYDLMMNRNTCVNDQLNTLKNNDNEFPLRSCNMLLMSDSNGNDYNVTYPTNTGTKSFSLYSHTFSPLARSSNNHILVSKVKSQSDKNQGPDTSLKTQFINYSLPIVANMASHHITDIENNRKIDHNIFSRPSSKLSVASIKNANSVTPNHQEVVDPLLSVFTPKPILSNSDEDIYHIKESIDQTNQHHSIYTENDKDNIDYENTILSNTVYSNDTLNAFLTNTNPSFSEHQQISELTESSLPVNIIHDQFNYTPNDEAAQKLYSTSYCTLLKNKSLNDNNNNSQSQSQSQSQPQPQPQYSLFDHNPQHTEVEGLENNDTSSMQPDLKLASCLLENISKHTNEMNLNWNNTNIKSSWKDHDVKDYFKSQSFHFPQNNLYHITNQSKMVDHKCLHFYSKGNNPSENIETDTTFSILKSDDTLPEKIWDKNQESPYHYEQLSYLYDKKSLKDHIHGETQNLALSNQLSYSYSSKNNSQIKHPSSESIFNSLCQYKNPNATDISSPYRCLSSPSVIFSKFMTSDENNDMKCNNQELNQFNQPQHDPFLSDGQYGVVQYDYPPSKYGSQLEEKYYESHSFFDHVPNSPKDSITEPFSLRNQQNYSSYAPVDVNADIYPSLLKRYFPNVDNSMKTPQHHNNEGIKSYFSHTPYRKPLISLESQNHIQMNYPLPQHYNSEISAKYTYMYN